MTIIRDGKEIKLTTKEVELAYREQERYYHIEDVKLFCKRNDIDISPFDDDDLDAIACSVEDFLDDNEQYWESYWESFDSAISAALKQGGK